MAKMPRGEPRSVPDPLGDEVEAVHRQERLRREAAEDAAARSQGSLPPLPFAPFDRIARVRDGSIATVPTVTIGGKTYREVDNGQANVLVPIDNPLFTPAELAAQRRAIARAAFMARNPIGSVAYVAASLTGAPPATRDAWLAAGGVADAALMGAAPRGTTIRSPTIRPQRQPDAPTLRQDPLRLRELNANGQARGTNATVTRDMLGPGRRPDRRLKPPGWRGDGRKYNEARGHLHAGRLDGPHNDPRNFVTLTQNKANSSHMKTFENAVARRTGSGEVVQYSVTPLYADGVLPPELILMSAYGSRGAPAARIVQNPAGRRR